MTRKVARRKGTRKIMNDHRLPDEATSLVVVVGCTIMRLGNPCDAANPR